MVADYILKKTFNTRYKKKFLWENWYINFILTANGLNISKNNIYKIFYIMNVRK
jgi:hypothetical protein